MYRSVSLSANDIGNYVLTLLPNIAYNRLSCKYKSNVVIGLYDSFIIQIVRIRYSDSLFWKLVMFGIVFSNTVFVRNIVIFTLWLWILK